MSFKGVNY